MRAETMTSSITFSDLTAKDLVTVPERVAIHAATRPSETALVLGDRGLSWGALCDQMYRVANYLQSRGVGLGDRIAIMTGHNLDWQAVHLGASAAGATVVMMPTALSPDAIQRMVVDCGAKVLFVSPDYKDLADAVVGDVAITKVLLTDAIIAAASSQPLIVPRRLTDEAEIIYSSGTTGQPKGIVVGTGARNRSYLAYGQFGMDRTSVMLCTTPPYANPTLGSTFGTMVMGGKVVYLAKFDVTVFLTTAEMMRATHMFLVPTQVIRLLADPAFDRYDLSATKLKLTGSAALPIDAKRDLLARWPGAFVETYGMTEGGPIAVLLADQFPHKLDSVGMIPNGAVVKIIDDSGRDVAVGEVGEIVGRSGAMMLGYNNRPEDSKAIEWRGVDGQLYFRSGDLGRFDADGFLYIVGRKKDVIVSGGFNIYAVDLEAVLMDHPDVLECAVVACPDPKWGETPVAIVEPKNGQSLNADALKTWANARLGKHQRLSAVDIRNDLPRGPMGKILKNVLRDELTARVSKS